VCAQIFPLLGEVEHYYRRAGQVIFDISLDDTFNVNQQAHTDWFVYYKRFCDRPQGEASKAWFTYLDWAAPVWDKSAYVARRNMAKGSGEYSKWRVWIYGPMRFNWWRAHATPWARGEDAAGMKFPMWGDNGEERARKEYSDAKDKCLDRYWHYYRIEQIKKMQVQKAAGENIPVYEGSNNYGIGAYKVKPM
jgi:hypothetical protein